MISAGKSQRRLKVISLFSGCGGLDLGFTMSGRFSLKFANDINESAAKVYSENFNAKIISRIPDRSSQRPLFLKEDIQNIDFGQIKSILPDIDVVIGGPPCQDFSLARGTDRANAGIYTQRGKLYAYFVKALMYLRPKYFVFENVPGIKSDNKGMTWDIIREDFSNLSMHAGDIEKIAGDGFSGNGTSYFLAYHGIADASAVGTPQKRKRVIIIGIRKDLIENSPAGSVQYLTDEIRKICRSKIEGEGLCFSKYPLTSIEAFEGKTLDTLDDRYRSIMEEWLFDEKNRDVPELNEWAEKNSNALDEGVLMNYCKANSSQFLPVELEKAMDDHRKVLESLGFIGVRVLIGSDQMDKACSIPTENPRVVSRLYFTPPDKNYKFLYNHKCWKVEGKNISMIYRRLHPLKPAYTVTANGGGGTHGYHYEKSRGRLTNRERARLQSFPDWFKFSGTYTQQREIIGNAVPPLLGKAVAMALSETDHLLNGKSSRERMEHPMPGTSFSRR